MIVHWLWLLFIPQDPPFGTRTSPSPRETASRLSTSVPRPVKWTTSSAPSLSRLTTPPRKTQTSPTPAVPSRFRSRKPQVNKAPYSILIKVTLCGNAHKVVSWNHLSSLSHSFWLVELQKLEGVPWRAAGAWNSSICTGAPATTAAPSTPLTARPTLPR